MSEFGPERRERIVEKFVDKYAPVGRYDHTLDGLVRFNTFGAVREAVVETVNQISQTYPQLSGRIQASFGMSGWEPSES